MARSPALLVLRGIQPGTPGLGVGLGGGQLCYVMPDSSMLEHIIWLCINILQYIRLYYSILHCITLSYTLYHIILSHCITLYNIIWCRPPRRAASATPGAPRGCGTSFRYIYIYIYSFLFSYLLIFICMYTYIMCMYIYIYIYILFFVCVFVVTCLIRRFVSFVCLYLLATLFSYDMLLFKGCGTSCRSARF